nr:DUF3798 domain-containing protein [uncultured Peptostreptococcus sp.]
MLKRLMLFCLASIIAVGLVACNKSQNTKKDTLDMTDNKAEITIYIDKGTKFDPKYLNSGNVAINYLPNINGDFNQEYVKRIVNAVDKNVKVLVIATNKSGLEPVFKSVKTKLPGVVTVANGIGELSSVDKYLVAKDKNIDIGLVVSDYLGRESLITAKEMSAKSFIYLVSKENISKKEYVEDINKARLAALKYQIDFTVEEVGDNLDDLQKKLDAMNEATRSTTAIYSADRLYSDFCLDNLIKNKFILPNINSLNDGDLLAKKLDIKTMEKFKSREDFDKAVSKVLASRGLSNKLAGISESRNAVTSEIVIEVANYMYEKNFNLEECYTNISLLNRANTNLNLSLNFDSFGIAYGYFRELSFLSRIY